MQLKEIQHLYWRAGFGIQPDQIQECRSKDRLQVVNELFLNSNDFEPLHIDTFDLEQYTAQRILQDKSTRQNFIKESTEKLKSFNALWFQHIVDSNQVLREKMTLFWANHFVCRDVNIFHVQQYHNTLREHALGDFGDFVKAISKEPAMLKYLNNKQNRKQKPNENFARELMELFTLGEGQYSEEDIRESARAFTGYNHNFEGDFMLRQFHHDFGFKSFFGHRGRYDGDDIIDIILEQKQCARFICEKIYRCFVNDQVDPERVEELTSVFYKDYNIENLMRYLFLSDWFYDTKHIGIQIKSPVDLMVGMSKTVPIRYNKTRDVLKIQKLLGQVLLNPPNVAGWPGGRNWIDSNTLMLRLKLPSIILANARISIKEKGEFEDSFDKYYKRTPQNKFADVEVNWEVFESAFQTHSFEELQKLIIVPEMVSGSQAYMETLSKNSKRNFCVQLMSLPEYQMC